MLDSLGIVPDIVVGTSMGAIVGGMYASGYSGAEIEKLTRRFNIGAYIGRYAPRAPRAFAISGASGTSLLGSQLPGEPHARHAVAKGRRDLHHRDESRR